jgi:hypothetical protein
LFAGTVVRTSSVRVQDSIVTRVALTALRFAKGAVPRDRVTLSLSNSPSSGPPARVDGQPLIPPDRKVVVRARRANQRRLGTGQPDRVEAIKVLVADEDPGSGVTAEVAPLTAGVGKPHPPGVGAAAG